MKTQRSESSWLWIVTLAVLALSIITSSSGAQTLPDRRVDAISVTPVPGGPGLFDIHGVWRVLRDGPASTFMNCDTEVELRINGSTVGLATHLVTLDPDAGSCTDGGACAGSCGSGTVDGVAATLICQAEGPCGGGGCDCKCGPLPFSTPFSPQPLAPGDELMILLRPAPGALPDADPSDDVMVILAPGTPVYWNRQIDDVEVTPSAAQGDVFFDVDVLGTTFYDGVLAFSPAAPAPVPLSMEVELRVNGVPWSVEEVDFEPVPASASCNCGNQCGSYGGFPHFCVLGGISGCNCGWPWIVAFPTVPLEPGDELVVLLRPVPGALPELPGFEEDDDRRETHQGSTSANVLAAHAGQVDLRQNHPNPFRQETSIAFATAGATRVTLDVYGVNGGKVRTLIDARYDDAGDFRAHWDGRTDSGQLAPAGVYFYRLQANGETRTKKMTIAN